jgi:hypothetical protein
MLVYWIYALLSIFYSWLFYKLTEKNRYGIIFYIISLVIVALYYVTYLIINLYLDLKYKNKIDKLECKLRQCKNIIKKKEDQDTLCKNTFYCDDHYLCKRVDKKSRNCVIKGDCLELITKNINEININKAKEFNKIMNTLDKIGIHKNNLDNYLKIYLIVLSFIFLFFLLYLYYFNKINIIFDLTFLDLNYIKKKLNKIN